MAVTFNDTFTMEGNITLNLPGNATTFYTATPMSSTVQQFALFCWGLHKYLTPVIIAIGLIGNITSFLVFVKTHVRCLSSSVYLAALAIADTGFLVQLFINWLNYLRIFILHTQGWCQGVVYLSYVCSFLSVWYVVGFTVERYIAVCYPLKRQDMCTSLRAKKVVLGLACFACVAYSYGAWTSGIVVPDHGLRLPQCQPLPQYLHLVNILNNIDTVITLIIPSITIFVLNIRLAARIKYFYDKRMVMTATNKSQQGGSFKIKDFASRSFRTSTRSDEESPMVRQKTQMGITKMLLVVSTIFLILNLPCHVIRVHAFVMGFVDPNFIPPTLVLVWQQLFTIIYYTNFSVNFFLYSLCGKNFRSALWRMFLPCRLPCHTPRTCENRLHRRQQKTDHSPDNNTMKSFVTNATYEANGRKIISDL